MLQPHPAAEGFRHLTLVPAAGAPSTAQEPPSPDASSVLVRRRPVQPGYVLIPLPVARTADGAHIAANADRVGSMRRIAAAHLGYWGGPSLIEPVTHIVTELVTNALVHGRGTNIRVLLAYLVEMVTIEVETDRAPTSPPRPRTPEPDEDESGRGLCIVDALTAELGGRWGTTAHGRITWCALPVSEAAR